MSPTASKLCGSSHGWFGANTTWFRGRTTGARHLVATVFTVPKTVARWRAQEPLVICELLRRAGEVAVRLRHGAKAGKAATYALQAAHENGGNKIRRDSEAAAESPGLQGHREERPAPPTLVNARSAGLAPGCPTRLRRSSLVRWTPSLSLELPQRGKLPSCGLRPLVADRV